RRGRRPLFLGRDVDAARLEGRGEILLRLDQALLLPGEPLAFCGEAVQLLSQGVLQFDEGFVLRRGLLLAGVHLLADLEHVPLARLERPEPLVLELDEFLLAHRELLVAIREAAFHADEPLNRVGQGALPLRRELLALEERLDLGLGFLEVTGKVHVEPPDAVLVVLDRLLAVVQGPGPFLDAPFLGAGLLPLDTDGAEVVVDRGAGRGDLLLLLLEVVPLALQALRLSFQVGRAGLRVRPAGPGAVEIDGGRADVPASAVRHDGGLSNGVRQTKDTYSGGCRTAVSALPYGWRAEKGWNMPALKEISFEYARQIASVKGLQPSKVIGTSTLRFSKGT